MTAAEHKSHAPQASEIRVAIISVSDSRRMDNDEGGALAQTMLEAAGFSIVGRSLVRDEPADVRGEVQGLIGARAVEAIVLTGGTGVSPRDQTLEAVAPLFGRTLDGFGELFRVLSFSEIGAAAMLSRATAGTIDDVAVFLMPGSPAGVRLALERLILPELRHLVGQLRRRHSTAQLPSEPESPAHDTHDHRH